MKKVFIFCISSALLVACGTSKTGKQTSSSSSKKTSTTVSPEVKNLFHSAMQSYLVHNNDKALKEISAYVSKNPKDDAGFYLLSKLQFEAKDTLATIKSLENATNIDPNNKWYNEELGYLYLSKNEFQKAADIFQKLVKKEPREANYQLNLLQSYYGLKQFDNCLQVINNIENVTGKNPDTYIQRFTVYSRMKKYDDAEKILMESITLFPEDDRALFNLNDLYNARNQKQKMISYLEKTLKENPENTTASLLMAEYLLQKNEYYKAEQLLLKVYQNPTVDPTYKRYFLIDNYIERKLMSNTLAEKLAMIGYTKNPEDGFFSLLLGDIYDKQGNTLDASTYYKKSIDLTKNNKEALLRIVYLEFQNANYEELIKYSQKALELYPSEKDLYYFYSIGLLKTRKYDECIDVIENGLVYVTDNAVKVDYLTIQAEALFGKKETTKARKLYESLIVDNPTNEFLKNNYALALTKYQVDHKTALTIITKLLEKSPKNNRYLFTKGLIFLNQNQLDDALKVFQEIYVSEPNDSGLNDYLGDVYAKKGDLNKAVEYWLKAKEFGSKNVMLEKKIEEKKYYEELF